jgi:predicted HAD superfamily phosphohydrolase YqeG
MNLQKVNIMKTTYDVVFNDDENSNSKGFAVDLDSAIAYIQANNGSNFSYFADYKGGTVSIVCNETGETVYQEDVK